MVRVKNWPNLRSLKWKIRDKHSVGIHSNVSSWMIQNIRTKTVPTVRYWSLKPVPGWTTDFDLTWCANSWLQITKKSMLHTNRLYLNEHKWKQCNIWPKLFGILRWFRTQMEHIKIHVGEHRLCWSQCAVGQRAGPTGYGRPLGVRRRLCAPTFPKEPGCRKSAGYAGLPWRRRPFGPSALRH